ncbi:MAG: helix-turn-helix domain-containing protein [bacterium]|nr:helix-turn-helix domain-containing protein [bacterium]
MSFGKNLAKFRKQRGLTQEQLVKLSGVGISQIRRYEADKSTPSLDAAVKIVKVIGVSIDEMVFDKPSAFASNKIVDRELLEQFEMVSYMDEEERQLVKKILEGVIVKNQVEKLLKPTPEKPWSQRFREITDRLAQGAKEYSQDDIDKVIDEAVSAVRKENYARF